MAEPDEAKAIALLESKEAARLMKQAQQLRPAFSSWVNTLSTVQKEEVMQRFMKESTLMQYVDSLEHDPRIKARFVRNSKLENLIQGLIYYAM